MYHEPKSLKHKFSQPSPLSAKRKRLDNSVTTCSAIEIRNRQGLDIIEMFQKQTKENGHFDLNRKEQWINIFMNG